MLIRRALLAFIAASLSAVFSISVAWAETKAVGRRHLNAAVVDTQEASAVSQNLPVRNAGNSESNERISQGKTALTPPDGGTREYTDDQLYRAGHLMRIPECWEESRIVSNCVAQHTPAMVPTGVSAPSRSEVETLVRTLVSRLDIPAPRPRIGPDPSVNEWNMAVVGYPLWLWTDTSNTFHSALSGYGITITMNASRSHTTFDMGDGRTVRCTAMTPYNKTVTPATPSPTCGYTYSWPSLPGRKYTVTATSHWSVAWEALGYSGTIPLTVTGSREIPVGELHAVVVR